MYYALAFFVGAFAASYVTYHFYEKEKKAMVAAVDDFHWLVTQSENVRNDVANFVKTFKAKYL